MSARSSFSPDDHVFRRVVDSLPNYAVILFDREGRIEHVNPAAESVYGYDAIGLHGRTFATLLSPDVAGPARVEDILACATSNGSFRGESRHRRRDGTEFDADVVVTPQRSPDGTIAGFSALIRDVSDRRRQEQSQHQRVGELETRIEQLMAEVNSRGRELEAFTYSVAHDLRAPLRGISGYLDALRDDYAATLEAQGRDYLERSIKCAERMHALIDDLVKLSRAGRHEMTVTPTSLRQLVDEIVVEQRATRPERAIEWRIGDLPNVAADVTLLRTVLANLVSNSVKFTVHEPHPRIEVGHETLEKEHVLVVRDNGVGFDSGRAADLFTPFYRMHPAHEFEGNGIGLAVAARIVRRHGGRIWAESRPGAGAAFYFTLPRSAPEPG